MSAKGKSAAPRFPEIPPEQVPETFTLRQGKTMLATGVIVLVAFGGTTAWSAVAGGELNMLGICVLSVLAGLVILAKYRNHRLEVRGERLFYRDLFGKSWEFGVEEIVSVRRDLSENPKLMGGKRPGAGPVRAQHGKLPPADRVFEEAPCLGGHDLRKE